MLVRTAGVAGENGSGTRGARRRQAQALLVRFGKNRDGNIVFLFAFMATILFLFAGGAVDFTRWNAVRADMIESMDAAGLAMAQIDALNGPEVRDLTDADRTNYLKLEGQKFFYENFKHRSDVIDLNIDFDITAQKITPRASGRIKTLFLGLGQSLLFGISSEARSLSYLNLSSETEIIRRDDGNIEVAMVLDITGSMGGSRITDLKSAAKELVDIVVRDNQVDWYSKVALVPYSMGVNVGSYANASRGSIVSGVSISNAVWKDGSGKGISNVEKLNPVRVTTSSSHGFSNGDTVWIEGVNSSGSGSSKLSRKVNDKAFTISSVTSNSFRLSGVNGSSWSGTYSSSSSDYATKCVTSDCEVLVSAASHGFDDNDYIHIDGVEGMEEINNSITNGSMSDDVWRITRVDADSFILDNSVGPLYGAYDAGGTAWCTDQGCEFYYFENDNNDDKAFRITSCVTERVGANEYTDAAPSTTRVGRLYKGPNNTCPDEPIQPLSIDRTALKASIENYVASGSTAGQIGIAWAWYLLSPTFGGELFTGGAVPASYEDEETTKVAVLMTDGEFNTPYCNGVIAQDATSGSGGSSDHINCNATNGNPYVQAEELCEGMKDEGIVIYTIGFDISSSTSVTNLLTNCATGPEYVFFALNGDELKQIYRDIGSEITKLHIGK